MQPAPADESTPKSEVEAAQDEDKQRKIVRLLESGDEFQAVYNVSSIRGVDSYRASLLTRPSPTLGPRPTKLTQPRSFLAAALLLIGRKNLYLVDGYHYTDAGEVVDSFEAPDEVRSSRPLDSLFASSSSPLTRPCSLRRTQERDPHLQTLADLAGRNTRSPSSNAHLARRWTWQDVAEVHERRFLFRNCALELFFADGQGVFLTYARDRQVEALADLADRCPHAVASGSLSFTDPSFGGKLGDALLGQRTKLERMTKRWEQRQISNFECASRAQASSPASPPDADGRTAHADLMFLNTSSGRSYYDLTCYPVMPWIIADYDSHEVRPPAGLASRRAH